MSAMPLKCIRLEYFAALRERFGMTEETVTTAALTPRELFEELARRGDVQWPVDLFRVAINGRYVPWDTTLNDDDCVVFIQPVAGG